MHNPIPGSQPSSVLPARKLAPDSSTSGNFTLRLAEPRDAKSIAQLGAHIFTVSFGYSLPAADLTAYLADSYTEAALLKDIANPNVTIVVACNSNDEVVGFLQLRRDSHEPCIEDKPKPIELQRLYVDPKCHGQGVARVMVDESYRIALQEGYQTMWLGVWEENFKAQRVYEKLGFVQCGKHDFVMGECVQTDWIMYKTL